MEKSSLDVELTDKQFAALSHKTQRDILRVIYDAAMSPRGNCTSPRHHNGHDQASFTHITGMRFGSIAAATDQSVPDGLKEFEVPAATWCVVSGHPASTYEDLFRGLVLDYLPFSEFEYVELPNIEVYPTYSKSKMVSIKEAWFPVKQVEK